MKQMITSQISKKQTNQINKHLLDVLPVLAASLDKEARRGPERVKSDPKGDDDTLPIPSLTVFKYANCIYKCCTLLRQR